MADIVLHAVARSFREAYKAYLEVKPSIAEAELWLARRGKVVFAVITRKKRRGRKVKIKLLERLDVGDFPLPKEFKVVGRWVQCMALNDMKTLIIRGDGLRLQPK